MYNVKFWLDEKHLNVHVMPVQIPLIDMVNTNIDTNAFVSKNGSDVTLTAKHDLAEGDEVCLYEFFCTDFSVQAVYWRHHRSLISAQNHCI